MGRVTDRILAVIWEIFKRAKILETYLNLPNIPKKTKIFFRINYTEPLIKCDRKSEIMRDFRAYYAAFQGSLCGKLCEFLSSFQAIIHGLKGKKFWLCFFSIFLAWVSDSKCLSTTHFLKWSITMLHAEQNKRFS